MQARSINPQSTLLQQGPETMKAGSYHMSYSDHRPPPYGDLDYDPQHNMDNYDEAQLKTFYNKTDSMSTGPYATTVILSSLPERVCT